MPFGTSTEIGGHMTEEEKEELRRRGYTIEGDVVSAPRPAGGYGGLQPYDASVFTPGTSPTWGVGTRTSIPPTTPPTTPPVTPPTMPKVGSGLTDGSLLDPFTGQFERPDMGAAARAALGVLPDVPQFQGPDVPTIDPFQIPTGEDVTADPGFRFRLDEGLQALQNAAAAKGLLRSGGTLKDFIRYGQGFASNEYQNVFNRNQSVWEADTRNTFGTFDRRLDVAQSEFAPKMTGYQTQAQAAQRGAELSYDRAWKEYLTDWDIFEQNQGKIFDRLFATQELGLRAAGA